MRILIFNWRDIKNPGAGGAEVVTHEHAKRWVKAGHKVTLFCAAFTRGKKEETIDGINIIRKGNRYTVYWRAFCYYRKHFRGNFDLVIDEINTLPFFTPLYVKEPIVAFIHQLCRKIWFYESRLPIAIIGFLIEPFCLRMYRNIPIMTVSQSTKKDLVGLGFKEEKIHIISEGVSLEPLSRLKGKEEKPTLIYVGKLKRSKRVHHIIKAFSIIKKELPEARLWLVGEGDKPYRARLENLVERLKLKDITFYGFKGHEKKRELMQRAQAIVMSSVKEGWGLSVTEANALGTPAVVYDVDGLRDSTKDYLTGLICPKNNPSSLAKMTSKLLKDSQFQEKLSKNARRWARKFSWDKSAKESLAILTKLCPVITHGLKILIFNWRDIKNPLAGGAERLTHELAKRWVNKGHKVTLFSSAFAGYKKEEIIDGVKIMRAGNRLTVYYQAFRYYKKSFRGQYDIVIDEINTIPFFTPLYVKEPLLAHINQLAREIWFHEIPFPLSILGFLIEPWCLKIYRNIPVITISQSSKEGLLNLGFSKTNIQIIPVGMNLQIRRRGNKEKEPTLIWVNRVIKSKRLEHVLRAFEYVKKKIPNAKLWIVGPHSPPYRDRLQRLVQKLGLKDVIFYNFVEEKRKQELIQKAHLIISTSVREGWGLTITEANALGTPAVVYNVAGLRDSTKNNKTGLICGKNTPQVLAENIIKLLGNNSLYQRLQEGAYRWGKDFNWDRSAQKVIEIIEKLIP